MAQQEREPSDEAAESVIGGSEKGIVGIAVSETDIVAARAVLGFEMDDNGLDSKPTAQFPLDLWRAPSLLAGEEAL